ncbi:efflux RND transporter periplasmic adaptor subunit [Limisalsivibrio acetivorans]|uniref:efflux RND transporter periplasmic adaptor subunit n=1 Tax=Limisalsivibrio acetivorans TaxID=1304888 RepID=UPI0003B6F6A0|nr:efflux RND transporter periplasmic adaptor subunit [Limisalsivibrio acetivorans]
MKKLILFLSMIVVAAGCSGGGEKESEKPEARTMKVTLGKAETTSMPASRSFSATVSSDKTAMLIPKVVGYVEAIHVSPGESFEKGDLLVSIKSTELEEKKRFAESAVQEAESGFNQAEIGLRMAEGQLKQAESNFELAKKTYDRYSNLIKNDSVSKQEFDQVESKYEQAKEQVNIVRENVSLAKEKMQQLRLKKQQAEAMLAEVQAYLSYTEIRAPFNGVVLEKLLDTGNLAAPGNPILKIGNNEMVVYAFLNESLINDISVGSRAEITVDSLNFTCSSTVLQISPDIDAATRNFKVKLSGHERFVPGMYAKVSIATGEDSIVTVPENALVQRGQLSVVFVEENMKADMRIVKTGRNFEGVIEILSGVKAGESIVVQNAEALKTGDKLETE